MKYSMLVIALFLSIALPSTGTVWPPSEGSSGPEMIVRWGINDASLSPPRCAQPYSSVAADVPCSQANSLFYAERAFTISRLNFQINSGSMTATEGCDLILYVNNVNIMVADIELGSVGLRDPGDLTEVSASGFSDTAVAAGETVQFRMENPTDTTYCVSGAACTCTGASISFWATLYGS